MVARSKQQPRKRVIVVVAPKGGVGKTTLTMALLVSAARAGYRTLGVNLDGQPSLDLWNVWRRRQIEMSKDLHIVDLDVENLHLSDYPRIGAMNDHDVIVVDTPPGHSDAQSSVRGLCEMADLILIPTSSSGIDLAQVIPFRTNVVTGNSWYILNRINRRTSDYHESKAELLKSGRLCPVDIPALVAIARQFKRGLAMTDHEEVGSEWFHALWNFVRQEVNLPAKAPRALAEKAA